MTLNEKSTQRIRDPVHGLIRFGGSGDRDLDDTDRIAWALLNTPEFQRLRRIRQLGFSDLVFPGATHSRFAHSIGVYHMARRLVEIIRRKRDDRRDFVRERVVLLAALLHDIGHGPFSHVFESVAKVTGLERRHEQWSVEIIKGDTGVNRVLRKADETLPEKVGSLLEEEEPGDIYSTVVSSQFDADRLDYLQRDRMAAGVGFGHLDLDWLLDCLEVGTVTINSEEPYLAPCLYLGPKGVQVAEEYLEARSRLYRMIYMHKTTRSAENMLESLLKTVAAQAKVHDSLYSDPVSRYLTSQHLSTDSYLALDDSAVWAAISIYSESSNSHVSILAKRLRDRQLYKCVDIGVHDQPGGNLFGQFRRALAGRSLDWMDEILFDDTSVTPYKWYNFDDASALNKVFVKDHSDKPEPEDILKISKVVKVLHDKERIQRVYVPEANQAKVLEDILREVTK